MNSSIDYQKLSERMLKKNTVFGAVFNVENGDGSFRSLTAAGNLATDQPYCIASVTKLYVSAAILVLRRQGKLELDDPIVKYLGQERLRGLHLYKGTDYSDAISIRHLLANQSGLRDYFFYEQGGTRAVTALNEHDPEWPLDKVIERARTLKPLYKPGQPGKVNYSDTNYRLLGGIIEEVSGLPVGMAFDRLLFAPLGLKHTFVYDQARGGEAAGFYYNRTIINAPRYMSSISAEGGIVSTAAESMAFLKAFFNGFFFPAEDLALLDANYRMIMVPGQFYFGTGIEKLWIPRLLSGGQAIDNVLGFWGQTGAFAFYHKDSGLYFTGTVNQANGFGHGGAFKAMLACIKAANKAGLK